MRDFCLLKEKWKKKKEKHTLSQKESLGGLHHVGHLTRGGSWYFKPYLMLEHSSALNQELQQTWKCMMQMPLSCHTALNVLHTVTMMGLLMVWQLHLFFKLFPYSACFRLAQGQIKLLVYTLAGLMVLISLLSNDDNKTFVTHSSIWDTLLN